MLKYVVEVKCSNHSTARTGSWSSPARIWVRGYGDAPKPVYEKTIGFVDKRHTGKRSHYHEVHRSATRWAQFKNLSQQPDTDFPLDEFGRVCIEKYDAEVLMEKVRYAAGEQQDLDEWEIDKPTWDTQVVYALLVKIRQQQAGETRH